MGTLLVLLESSRWVGFNEGFWGKKKTWGVEDIEFWVIFVIGNSTKLQTMDLEGKN